MITAVFAVRAFRARNDDVALNSTSWTHAQDTNWTQDRDTRFRLRYQVAETAGGADPVVNWDLQYSINSGTWTDASGWLTASTQFTDDDAITSAQLGGTGTFLTTGSVGRSSTTAQIILGHSGSDYGEVEFSLIFPNTLSNGDTVQFRMLADSAVVTQNVTPTITVDASSATQDIAPTGIATFESVSSPVLTAGAVTLTPTGISSAEAFGTSVIQSYTAYESAVLADSPDAWWRFTETSGTSVADNIGSNDLTVTGATLSTTGPSETGSAVSFDGTDDKAESDSALGWDGAHSLTVEAWIKASSWTTASATPDSVFLLWVNESGNLAFQVRDVDDTTWAVASTTTPSTGAWHHVVGVWDRTQQKALLYVDGSLANSSAAQSFTDIGALSEIVQVGTDGGTVFTAFDLDELAIYNEALSSTRVLAHYNAGVPGVQTLTLTGIVSGESVSSVTLTPGAVNVTFTGISSAEAVGDAVLAPGIAFVTPGAIVTQEAIGNATLSTGVVVIAPDAVGSSETVGSTVVVAGAVTLHPDAITTLEAFGSATFVSFYGITPSGVVSLEQFGSQTVSTLVEVAPSSITTVEAFGAPTFSVGTVFVVPQGIASLEAFGGVTFTVGEVIVLPSGIASLEVLGDTVVSNNAVFLAPSSITTLETFGSSSLSTTYTISPSAISSGEQIGAPVFQGFYILSPSSIVTAEVFGNPSLSTLVSVLPGSIVSEEAIGDPVFSNGGVLIVVTGITSDESLSNPTLTVGSTSIFPSGVGSSESLGSAVVIPGEVTITPSGVITTETIGTHELINAAVTQMLYPDGIASANVLGAPVLSTGVVVIDPAGILSGEAFGVQKIARDGDAVFVDLYFIVGRDYVRLGA